MIKNIKDLEGRIEVLATYEKTDKLTDIGKGTLAAYKELLPIVKNLCIVGVNQQREPLKAYTKWLRQNDHLRNAPFPSLIDQYFNSL